MKRIELQGLPVQSSAGTQHYKDLLIDPVHHVILRQGQEIPLTAMEYALFETLLNKSGRICSRNELLETVWGITEPIQTRTVDVYISRLRQKLQLKQELRSVKRRGYLLERAADCRDSATPSIPM